MIPKKLKEKRIEYQDNGKWVHICCPFCQDTHFHGGFDLEKNFYNCWKCGWHSMWEIGQKLGIHFSGFSQNRPNKRETLTPILKKDCVLPTCTSLQEKHLAYLENRKIDTSQAQNIWNLKGTNHIGDWKNRIIIPIYRDWKLISYTSRDISGKSELRYKTCPKELEAYPAKNWLFGLDFCKYKSVIVVEGVFDTLRIGAGLSIATMGIGYTKAQVSLLTQFEKVFICFDSEPQAQKQAHNLAEEISPFCQTEIVTIQAKDAAESSDMEIQEIQSLIKV